MILDYNNHIQQLSQLNLEEYKHLFSNQMIFDNDSDIRKNNENCEKIIKCYAIILLIVIKNIYSIEIS